MGGHFAALEESALMAADIKKFINKVYSGQEASSILYLVYVSFWFYIVFSVCKLLVLYCI